MTSLSDFLLARIAEDEAVARAVVATDYSKGRWQWESNRLDPYRSALVNDRDAVVLPSKHDDVYPSWMVADHIARHDPARVLAECEAKRRIVEEVYPALELEFGGAYRGEPATLLLQLLALPYADHPDFREEWRP